MVRATAGLGLVLALCVSTALARDEITLDKLTTIDVQKRLATRFAGEKREKILALLLAKTGVQVTVAPGGVEYEFANGKPKFTWKYASPSALDADQAKQLREALWDNVLRDVLSQQTLSEAAFKLIDPATDFVLVPDRQPPQNTAPTISAIADQKVETGKTVSVSFMVTDKETSSADLKVLVVSPDATLFPAGSLVLGGTGVLRELAITPAAGKTGTATVRIGATDEGGLTGVATFAVTVTAASGGGTNGMGGGTGGTGGTGMGGAGGTNGGTGAAPAYGVAAGGICGGAVTACPPARGKCCLFSRCGGRKFHGGGCCGGGVASSYSASMGAYPVAAPVYMSAGPVPVTLAVAPYRVTPDAAVAVRPSPVAQPVASASDWTPVSAKADIRPADADKVVSRAELLKGKTAADWAALYDAGFRAYWAGKHAQAVECCAAAAELSDDPRGWYYLSLSLAAAGDADGARDAARYAAARVKLDPYHAASVNQALTRVQGPTRDRLTWLDVEVGSTDRAREIVAARPKLNKEKPGVEAGAVSTR